MLAIRDPAIKLFGKTIPVLRSSERGAVKGIVVNDVVVCGSNGHEEEIGKKDPSSPETRDRNPSPEDEKALGDGPTEEKESGEANESVDNGPLKKPDKLLPCPRCNSMDTKFCYYNNYNVNQPRHFCKSCQRYWTAGGVMRNVPVGSGRRKNKSSVSAYSRHTQFTVSKALQAAQDAASAALNNSSAMVLTFGANAPLPREPVPSIIFNRHDDRSSGSSVTTTSSSMDHEAIRSKQSQYNPIGDQSSNGSAAANPIPCFPVGIQWPYAVPLPAYCPPAFPIPIPIYPAPYFNSNAILNPPTTILGKHPREDDNLVPRDDNRDKPKPPTVLVPKTLRIVDPDEAAMSSIWTTLGIKKEKIKEGGFFRGVGSKSRGNSDHDTEKCMVLKANPVALCRSISFQETV